MAWTYAGKTASDSQSGLAGMPGPPGPQGPRGPAGSPQPVEFAQASPADLWSVEHDLGRFPTVNVIDSAGTQVIGAVSHADENHLTISFSSPFSGRVILS